MDGKVALVTGARRIGGVVAAELAAHGADVAIAYHRSHAEAEATAAAVAGHGRRAIVLQADLRRPAAGAELVRRTVEALGRLDVVVNFASVYAAKPFAQLTVADLEESLAVHVTSAFACAHAAVPHLRAAGGGHIVNCADWLPVEGRPGYRGYLPYYVAKGAVIALTEALALEVAGDGILVNAVAPGPIIPPADMASPEEEAVEKATPLGRWGGEMAVAKAVCALLDLDFVTGETLRVDGGRHLR